MTEIYEGPALAAPIKKIAVGYEVKVTTVEKTPGDWRTSYGTLLSMDWKGMVILSAKGPVQFKWAEVAKVTGTDKNAKTVGEVLIPKSQVDQSGE